jgi:hypothetical protein
MSATDARTVAIPVVAAGRTANGRLRRDVASQSRVIGVVWCSLMMFSVFGLSCIPPQAGGTDGKRSPHSSAPGRRPSAQPAVLGLFFSRYIAVSFWLLTSLTAFETAVL